MSVSSSTSRIVYAGNNSLVTAYAVPFYFQLSSHLVVVVTTAAGVETTLTEGSGYVVTGAGNPAGGGVVTSTAWNNTHTVTIFREVPATQLTSYADNDAFPAASHEAALDKLTLLVQQAIRKAGTGVRVTEASTPPAPSKSVPMSVAGLDASGNTVFRTPEALVEFLPEWFTVAALPPQTGNAGKLLSTNGYSASWTSEPVLKSLRITDAAYPYAQWTNTEAPTDKKKVRGYVELGGKVEFARVNDAETVGTNLIAWDINNNCGIGTGVPQAKLHVNAGVLGTTAFSTAEMGRWELNNGNNSTLRLLQVRNSAGTNWETTTTRLQQFTDITPQGFIEFNPAGMNYGVALGATNASNVNAPMLFLTGAGNGNNVGIGTPNTPSKLTVAGDVRLLTNGNLIVFTDQAGTTPYFGCGATGMDLTGTNAAGAQRSIFQCAMRSNTSPLQVNVPLKIGVNGANIYGVLKATVTHAIGTIAAGGFLELTSTVTGAIAGAMVHLGGSAPPHLIVRGYSDTGDTVSVMYHNPSAAAVNAGTRSIDLFVTNII